MHGANTVLLVFAEHRHSQGSNHNKMYVIVLCKKDMISISFGFKI